MYFGCFLTPSLHASLVTASRSRRRSNCGSIVWRKRIPNFYTYIWGNQSLNLFLTVCEQSSMNGGCPELIEQFAEKLLNASNTSDVRWEYVFPDQIRQQCRKSGSQGVMQSSPQYGRINGSPLIPHTRLVPEFEPTQNNYLAGLPQEVRAWPLLTGRRGRRGRSEVLLLRNPLNMFGDVLFLPNIRTCHDQASYWSIIV